MNGIPKFSICIPNYNYADYLPLTINSVLAQETQNLEIVVADNASTDSSTAAIERFQKKDARIRLRKNRTNVGFAGNLEKAASMARGNWMTMLSSDDLLDRSFLTSYEKIISELGNDAISTILSSTQTVIDGSGTAFDEIGIDWKMWHGAERDTKLSSLVGADVYRIDSTTLLRQSLLRMRTPFAFASMTYPRELYESVEGYCQTAIINPDKKFAWAILASATNAIVIDKPLVKYRVHNRNQGSQQAASGALKHLTDQYISTFSIDGQTLDELGLRREDIEKAFVEEDIALRGLLAISKGDRGYARRAIRFGNACYPSHVRRNLKCWAMKFALALGPIGTWLLQRLRHRQLPKWQRQGHKSITPSLPSPSKVTTGAA